MFDFYEKRKIKQRLYSWPSLIFLIIVSIFLTHGVWGVFQKEHQTSLIRKQRLSHLEELKTREDVLVKEINRLNTDRGIEEEIRQKFEVARPGEEVIVIVEQPLNPSLTQIEGSTGLLGGLLSFIIFWR